MSAVHVLASLIKTIVRLRNKSLFSDVEITKSSMQPSEKFEPIKDNKIEHTEKVETKDDTLERIEKGRIHFMGLHSEHENQVYVIIYVDNTVEIHCYTDGYTAANGNYGGRFMAGGCVYDFPIVVSLEYLNVAAFIREQTWIGDDFDSLISREEFEKQLNELYYEE
ncbi:MAG: hypothetical protein IKP66_02055 [Lachnospiraceae bacterium]|nr:hypothetical protein [Lachnospiraceae bacterium]